MGEYKNVVVYGTITNLKFCVLIQTHHKIINTQQEAISRLVVECG